MSYNQDIERLRVIRPALEFRHNLLRAIRTFFYERGYLEITTPIRVLTVAQEEHIDAEPSGDHYLRTSPEMHMKRLLAAGYEKIFQMGACFRLGERGTWHNPEYTMLEWYHVGIDYNALLKETQELIQQVALETLGHQTITFQGQSIDLGSPWNVVTVSKAFQQFAGWDPTTEFDPERFDLDLVEKVEPQLKGKAPVILTDYPTPLAALARRKPSNPSVGERWELYIGGLEIANAYTELTDPIEQRKRFQDTAAYREHHGKPVYPIDEDFLKALDSGLPLTAGIALGVDRLLMLFADIPAIADTIAFDS